MSKGKTRSKYRKGAEYGSARWGNAEDIKPYIDPEFQNNIILTQTERLTMNSRPKQPKYARNKNVVVIGGSGSGKTRFFVKPNLMQLHSSYVLTDPKGTVLIECGKLLQRAGYRIKVLNTINFKKSMHYNPFVYIRSEKDVLKVVNTLIVNTKGEGEKERGRFLGKSREVTVLRVGGLHLVRSPRRGNELYYPVGTYQRQRSPRGRRGISKPRRFAVCRLGRTRPRPFRGEAVPKIQIGGGQDRNQSSFHAVRGLPPLI